ncbi:hypothetical protein NMG60_11006743 [Bertholletia excelsa]
MSEPPKEMGAERDKFGPDYFAFYVREVADLLSQEDDFLPSSSQMSELDAGACRVVGKQDLNRITRSDHNGNENSPSDSLFHDGAGAMLSDFKKERLKALLQQSVFALSQEVDEMLDPVLTVHSIKSHLAHKKSLPKSSDAVCKGDAEQQPQKKIKMSSPSSIINPLSASPTNGKACLEVSDDLQQLLENDNVEVEGLMKKYSDELSTMLGHMEQQLEKLLDTVLSSCRSMTLSEKQQLQKLIQKLPPRNLDRVVEIIQCSKRPGQYSSDEIHVNMEDEDNVTLWRLYYYVEAVEHARKLSS